MSTPRYDELADRRLQRWLGPAIKEQCVELANNPLTANLPDEEIAEMAISRLVAQLSDEDAAALLRDAIGRVIAEVEADRSDA